MRRLHYKAAHLLLASWLRTDVPPSSLQRFIETELREVAASADLEGNYHPQSYKIGENPLIYEEWREMEAKSGGSGNARRCCSEIPAEITESNYCRRLVVQFMPGPDEEVDVDGWMDFWMIVVTEGGEGRVRYFEIEEPD